MNSVKRLFFALAASAVVLFAGQTARAQNMKFAVVDVQRAVSQTEDGLRAQATLKKLFDSRQQELNRKQQDMLKQREEIDKQAKVMSKEALQKRIEDLQKQAFELQGTAMEYEKEYQKKQRELTDPIVERVMSNIKRLAAQESYDLIVDKAAAAFVRSDLDLTDRVIQMSNAGGAAPAPAPKTPSAPAAPKP